MYVVFAFGDYRKEVEVRMMATFDKREDAIAFAQAFTIGEGEESMNIDDKAVQPTNLVCATDVIFNRWMTNESKKVQTFFGKMWYTRIAVAHVQSNPTFESFC